MLSTSIPPIVVALLSLYRCVDVERLALAPLLGPTLLLRFAIHPPLHPPCQLPTGRSQQK
jgi:hypothetical protein